MSSPEADKSAAAHSRRSSASSVFAVGRVLLVRALLVAFLASALAAYRGSLDPRISSALSSIASNAPFTDSSFFASLTTGSQVDETNSLPSELKEDESSTRSLTDDVANSGERDVNDDINVALEDESLDDIKDTFEDAVEDESENEIEGESEINTNSQTGSPMEVLFFNNWTGATSLFWDRSEDDWIQVVNSFRKGQTMSSFVGHRFMFTMEGTREQVGDVVEIKSDQKVYVLPRDAKTLSEIGDPCADRYPRRCMSLAERGECSKNPGWMIVNCPTACKSCELLDPKKRCAFDRLNISAEHIWAPGDLNAMFERILDDHQVYAPTVLSRPPEGPWLIHFENFLTDEEAEKLIEWGNTLGFERSTDSGPKNKRGEQMKKVSLARTSSNTWCSNECESDPQIKAVYERIERVTGVPQDHYESLQLLRYDLDQYYREHHDASPNGKLETAGPRILTFFLYINDVEEGGETDFPRINKRVTPKKGSAVLWPSVLDDQVWTIDERTRHTALPVIKGVKYGANAWIHARNFIVPNLHACTGPIG